MKKEIILESPPHFCEYGKCGNPITGEPFILEHPTDDEKAVLAPLYFCSKKCKDDWLIKRLTPWSCPKCGAQHVSCITYDRYDQDYSLESECFEGDAYPEDEIYPIRVYCEECDYTLTARECRAIGLTLYKNPNFEEEELKDDD